MRAEEVLAETYLFRDLPPDRLAAYAARTRRRRYPGGTYISREGLRRRAEYLDGPP
jgi:hypothetical protein